MGHDLRLPVISIDNQHCLTNTDVSYPRKYRRDAAVAKLVTRIMTPRADAYLVTSFFEAKVTRPGTFLFPPILRQSVLDAAPTTGEHVLVYVTSPAPALAKLLGSVRCPFVAYGFGREGQSGNVLYRKPSMDQFLKDLIGAKAVIANAGFSLMTEALHLGKPYLAIPIEHQFEQIFNAYWLDKMGYGTYWEELNKERIESFLYNLPGYRERLNAYPRRGNAALLDETLQSRRRVHVVAHEERRDGGESDDRPRITSAQTGDLLARLNMIFEAAVFTSLAVAVLSLFLFAWIGDSVAHDRTAGFDLAIRNHVHAFASPAFDKTMVFISFLGGDGLTAAVIISVIAFRWLHWRRAVLWMVVTILGALVLDLSLKYAFHRHRPAPVLCFGASHLQFSQRTLAVFILLLRCARGIADAAPQVARSTNPYLDNRCRSGGGDWPVPDLPGGALSQRRDRGLSGCVTVGEYAGGSRSRADTTEECVRC